MGRHTDERLTDARVDVLGSRPILGSKLPDPERESIERLLDRAVNTPNGHQLLRQLACWYREFAERTRNPLNCGVRLLLAQSLDDEAERIERLNGPT
jgi:hypothetical protein